MPSHELWALELVLEQRSGSQGEACYSLGSLAIGLVTGVLTAVTALECSSSSTCSCRAAMVWKSNSKARDLNRAESASKRLIRKSRMRSAKATGELSRASQL